MDFGNIAATVAVASDNWPWLLLVLILGLVVGWMVRQRAEQG